MTEARKKEILPPDLKKEIVSCLKAGANIKVAASSQRFFKEKIYCYGITARELQNLSEKVFDRIRFSWSLKEVINFSELLLVEKELETRRLAILVLSHFKQEFYPGLLSRFKGWLRKGYLDNWALVDAFSSEVISRLLIQYPVLTGKLISWVRDRDPRVKRGALVSMIKFARRKEYHPFILGMISTTVEGNSVDDFVAKAMGWLLREVGKGESPTLEAFLKKQGHRLPRVALRYSLERFELKKRKYFLEITKPPK
jgi:3-methyladenine DNA glycosylase AlkD